MGHPGDSYVLRAGKNKDILLGFKNSSIYLVGGPLPCAGPHTKE